MSITCMCVCTQTNSYQAVVITNDTESFAVFTYQCGSVSWHGHATIGYNAGGTLFENHKLSGMNTANSVACLNYSSTVWSNLVYRLTPAGSEE